MKRFCILLIFISFSRSVISAPTYTDIINIATSEKLEIADKEYLEALRLSDRANLPNKEMLGNAFKLLKSAAEKGHIYAMHDLAIHYKRGTNTEVNYNEAFEWYMIAAKLGFAGSQNNLGDMYESGQGVKQSYADAVYWYTQAAMQGEPTAYLSLGNLYMKGLGVKKNLVESAFWFTLAKAALPEGLNLKDASLAIQEVEKNLNYEQKKEVELRSRLFKPLRQTAAKLKDR